ncbi:MAG TPA: transposase [Gemmataceae bacterium]|nr:transposase [Gemmataceae bacterium]
MYRRIAEVFATPAPGLAAPAPGPAAAAGVVPGPALAGPPEGPPEEVGQAPVAAGQLTARQQQRLERYHELRRRHTEGQSLRRIAREMRLSKTTVLRHLRSGQCPDWRPGRTGPSRADPYRERIDAWLAGGNRNAAELHRLLRAEDPGLGYDMLRRFMARRLALRGEQRARAKSIPPPPPPPSPTGLSFGVIARPDKRTEAQAAQVSRLRGIDPVVDEVVGLVEGFAALVRRQGDTTLTEWQGRALAGSSIELRRFAEGLSRDQAAVQAAVEVPWSNGPVEGHINRLKTIKRQMYGRAGLALLRARVRHAG